MRSPASLIGLGIPPAQYHALAAGHPGGIAAVVEQRLQKLACDFPLADNYFAWQAFGRRYAPPGRGNLPPYLAPENFAAIKKRAHRIDVRLVSMTEHLRSLEARSADRFVLLDAQDWMSDDELTALWRQITRTARPGARVIFRTAAAPSLLPGRIPSALLDQWEYAEETSQALHRRDRSAIYGGFHLYMLKDGAA